MIQIIDKSKCCGCSACVSACPVHCITMKEDGEGFIYPDVDTSICIQCNKCSRVCPFSNISGEAPVLSVFAVKSLNDELRKISSSGGLFTELCKPILDSDGVVYGVGMDADCRGCSFERISSEDGLAALRGSKYMQADSESVFEQVTADLAADHRVLFVGTPCQANALSLYLDPDLKDGLLLVDFICHGVPSKKLWAAALDHFEEEKGAKVCNVDFRCKDISWEKYCLKIEFDDSTAFTQPSYESPYLRMFVHDLCLRESCYACEAKTSRSSDITIADFWGVKNTVPEMFDDLGCSLVIVRTDAGEAALKSVQDAVLIKEVPYDKAIMSNPSIAKSAGRPAVRDVFFDELDEIGYKGVSEKYGAVSAKERIQRNAKDALKKADVAGVAKKVLKLLSKSR